MLGQVDTITYDKFIERILLPDHVELSTSNLYIPVPHKFEFERADSIIQSVDTVYHPLYIFVEFQNQLGSRYQGINLKDIFFKESLIVSINGLVTFHASNCVFDNGFMGGTEKDASFFFEDCRINDQFRFWLKDKENDNTQLKIIRSEIFLSGSIAHIETQSGTFIVEETKIWAPDSLVDERQVMLKLKSEVFVLYECDIKVKVDFALGSEVSHQFYFANNNLTNLSLTQLNLPELPFSSYIPWNGIHESITTHYLTDGVFRNIKLDDDSAITVEEIYLDQHGTMYMLYSLYKSQGRLEYANPAYTKLKAFETRRWKYLYQQNKSFESLFRWQLNVFLNYFTDYGTNPAKAVIKSGWVILLFAMFYLFFPSDWDVSNRSQLLSKVKDLTSKNREKTFIATLAFVAYSAFIHILNALTLSLNAFTTLGFGDIPTHGAARYVTIVQGFIGWFLLTIFSVSLINQVLG